MAKVKVHIYKKVETRTFLTPANTRAKAVVCACEIADSIGQNFKSEALPMIEKALQTGSIAGIGSEGKDEHMLVKFENIESEPEPNQTPEVGAVLLGRTIIKEG